VGITYDEADTIRLSTEFPLIGSWARLLQTANNHLINTLWIKFCYLIGLESLFVLRLSSLISFLFYLYFCQRITYRILPGYSGLVCFFLLSCNLFLLDFFGLARGYSISIAFMMGALCLGLESLNSFSLDKSVKSLILASCSVISIYSMIYFWGALFLALHLIPLVIRDWNSFKKLFFRSLIIGGGLFSIIAPCISLLIWRGALYYGGDQGFYQDTILSLTKYSFYSPELMPIHYLASGTFILILTLIYVYSVFYNFDLLSPRVFVLFITLSIGSGIVLSHNLVGVLYPIDRVALFLYPIAILSLFLCLEILREWISFCISSILACVFFCVFVLNANFHKVIRWEFDSRTEQVLDAVNKKGEEINRVVSLGFDSSPLGPSMRYYLRKNRYPFIYDISSGSYEIPSGVDYYVHLSRRRDKKPDQQEHVQEFKKSLECYDKNVFLEYLEENIIVFCELNER